MTDYSEPQYNNLYAEILKDYNFRYGKFSPIPYPTLTNLHHHEQQRNAKTSRTKYQPARISRGR